MKAILWVTIVLTVGLYIVGPIQDPDLWWHIVVGRWILNHGQVPHVDYWTLFSVGDPWRAYSWSNEVLFALVDRWNGVLGLLTLKILVASLLSLSLSYCFARISRDWFLGAVLGIFSTAACFNHFTLRPQSLVWMFFVWVLYLSDKITREGFKRGPTIGLIITMMLWANTHLSAALGLVSAGAWSLGAGNPFRANVMRRAAGIMGLAFFGTLLTPYLGGEWMTFFETTSHPLKFQSIAEFQPATILQYSTGFLVLILALVGACIFRAPKAIDIPKLLLCAVFVVGALAVIKFLPFAVIILSAVVAFAWREAHQSTNSYPFGHLEIAFDKLRQLTAKIPHEGLSFVFICVSIVNVYKVWADPLAYEVTPVRAVDFIQKHKLAGPIMNIFGHGGYLMYRFSDEAGNPQQQISLDGRTNLIKPDKWEKYMAAFRGRRNWHEYLDAVKPQTILWRGDSSLPALLIADGNWCLVFESGPEKQKEKAVLVFVPKEVFTANQTELVSENCGNER